MLRGGPDVSAGNESWSVEKLAEILTRDTLVGVTVPRVPAKG
jgi:hypothetical protein